MEDHSTLAGFRAELYGSFVRARDALFEVGDALASHPAARSFVELSQAACCQRRWPSLYEALEDGRIDPEALRRTFVRHLLPAEAGGRLVLGVDARSISRPDARTAPDRTLVHVADVPRGAAPVRPGWQFSAVVALPAQPSSWAYSLDTAHHQPGHPRRGSRRPAAGAAADAARAPGGAAGRGLRHPALAAGHRRPGLRPAGAALPHPRLLPPRPAAHPPERAAQRGRGPLSTPVAPRAGRKPTAGSGASCAPWAGRSSASATATSHPLCGIPSCCDGSGRGTASPKATTRYPTSRASNRPHRPLRATCRMRRMYRHKPKMVPKTRHMRRKALRHATRTTPTCRTETCPIKAGAGPLRRVRHVRN